MRSGLGSQIKSHLQALERWCLVKCSGFFPFSAQGGPWRRCGAEGGSGGGRAEKEPQADRGEQAGAAVGQEGPLGSLTSRHLALPSFYLWAVLSVTEQHLCEKKQGQKLLRTEWGVILGPDPGDMISL